MRVRMLQDGIDQLRRKSEVAAGLGADAEKIRGRVRAPSKMTVTSRSGVGPRGAFAQVIMRGPGRSALAIEFGTRRTRPLAPLRSALRGG